MSSKVSLEVREAYGEWFDDIQATNTKLFSIEVDLFKLIAGAREQGQPWEAIGAALNMTKQGAQQWYSRRYDRMATMR